MFIPTYDNRRPFCISSKLESFKSSRTERRAAIVVSLIFLALSAALCGYVQVKSQSVILLLISMFLIGFSLIFLWGAFLIKNHEHKRWEKLNSLKKSHKKLSADIIGIQLLDTDPKDPKHAEYRYKFKLRTEDGDILFAPFQCAMHGNLFCQENKPDVYLENDDFATAYIDMCSILDRNLHYVPVPKLHQNLDVTDIPNLIYISKLELVVDEYDRIQRKAILSGEINGHVISSRPCLDGDCYKYLGCWAYAEEDYDGEIHLNLDRITNHLDIPTQGG